MKFMNVKDLRNRTREIVSIAGHETVIISVHGKPKAILVGMTEDEIEDYILATHMQIEDDYEAARRDSRRGQLVNQKSIEKRFKRS